MNNRAMIAMSGGVDSSVAAYLMKKDGFDCIGVTMKLYDNEDAGVSSRKTCCSLSDVEDARSVAYKLGMKYYVFNFRDKFNEKVIDKFVNSYLAGMTPNPCIDCNRYMKFGLLMQRAKELEIDYIATGHYAVAEKNEKTGKFELKKSADKNKDQTYVLWSLTQEELSHLKFPLGKLTKPEVRKIAEKNGFVNAEKHDSQDICFVPDGDYAKVIEMRTGKYPKGIFADKNGVRLGESKGIIHYTLGQGRHLGISIGKKAYVTKLDPEKNEVILGPEEDLFSDELTAGEFNWISGEAPEKKIECLGKVRYRGKEAECEAEPLPDGNVKVKFKEKQRAITPGQSVVLYDGDTVLGGGIIEAL